jgi:hypothetical protein
MPIKSMTTTPAPGHLVQICTVCGAENTISFDRGGQKSKTGPFSLKVGDTLSVKVDATPPATITFAAGDFTDFGNVTAAALAAKLSASLKGVIASDDFGGLLIESATTGAQSRIEITGGTARGALGFPTNGLIDPCLSRPVLGFSAAEGQVKVKDLIALRLCNNCGSNECLNRTFDTAGPEHDGTFFSEHRKAINALAEHWKSRGWSQPDVAADHAAETETPPDIDSDFPTKPCVPPPCEVVRKPRSRGSNEETPSHGNR